MLSECVYMCIEYGPMSDDVRLASGTRFLSYHEGNPTTLQSFPGFCKRRRKLR